MCRRSFLVKYERPRPEHRQRAFTCLVMCKVNPEKIKPLLDMANGDWNQRKLIHCCVFGCCRSEQVAGKQAKMTESNHYRKLIHDSWFGMIRDECEFAAVAFLWLSETCLGKFNSMDIGSEPYCTIWLSTIKFAEGILQKHDDMKWYVELNWVDHYLILSSMFQYCSVTVTVSVSVSRIQLFFLLKDY